MNTYKIRVSDIEWETDGADVDLPTEVVLDIEELSSEYAVEIAVDKVSDKYGFLINSCETVDITNGDPDDEGEYEGDEGGELDTDYVLDLIGTALKGRFDKVENCPGAVFIDHNGKTYSVSIIECEQC